MPNVTISQLPDVEDAQYFMSANAQGKAGKMTIGDLAAHMWDSMYIHAKAVIIACKFCHSHNAISNPTCVSCGAPMGE